MYPTVRTRWNYPNPTAASIQSINWGGSKEAETIEVTSPYAWSIRVGNCNQPVANAAVEVMGNNQTREGTSDANGWLNFYNLPPGSYSARSANVAAAPVAAATIDGTHVNQPSQLGTRIQPCPGFLPPIIFKPLPIVLKEFKLKQSVKLNNSGTQKP
ncbi:carboxypeptidase regulatory-like domain-containing protein [Terriglobus albidus]|uniref:Carboxypeptidase regulatory-like domain-containing protein n=1 Tax=Terriglobus albidus TaxID=1592106 RepID=A0A5B9EHV5_9BACT|nr:carboxypeptidase-like regulatory domain-containing protein [Terriglobus albidus]QEE29656.1 carboxypeptidase regulatory-like domain-containing protein [Terriglobus albidus]